jgi:hypothetical protein
MVKLPTLTSSFATYPTDALIAFPDELAVDLFKTFSEIPAATTRGSIPQYLGFIPEPRAVVPPFYHGMPILHMQGTRRTVFTPYTRKLCVAAAFTRLPGLME